jgi:hypothetical protein
MEVEPKNPAPVYAPEVVAKAILHCAEHPERDAFAGGGGKLISAEGYYAPRLTDKYMERTMIRQQRTDQPRHGDDNALFDPSGALEERGEYPGHVFKRSAYTKAVLHPWLTALFVVGTGLAFTALLRNGTSNGVRRQVQRAREAVLG